ncbi:hypothetical protein [Aquitalea sp. LB_tupeE]|uniref:hypothetical protein n=1 Tax=Aquitalea sp. LB_tupeE TaxID=2748078 RepID=UPI0015BB67D8|nr:hypothetical protein [Aquitalea sp. LB_tupeE]NWK79768.1 hypothetical protein [Aquitalea sp. LB_tupeE]
MTNNSKPDSNQDIPKPDLLLQLDTDTQLYRQAVEQLSQALSQAPQEVRQLALDLCNLHPELFGFKSYTATLGARLVIHLEPSQRLLEFLAAIRTGHLNNLVI